MHIQLFYCYISNSKSYILAYVYILKQLRIYVWHVAVWNDCVNFPEIYTSFGILFESNKAHQMVLMLLPNMNSRWWNNGNVINN